MPCDIATRLDALKIDVTIKVPPSLAGLVTESAGAFRVVFPDTSQPARLELSDAKLSDRFGGFINSVDADSAVIRFGMPYACLAISAQNELCLVPKPPHGGELARRVEQATGAYCDELRNI